MKFFLYRILRIFGINIIPRNMVKISENKKTFEINDNIYVTSAIKSVEYYFSMTEKPCIILNVEGLETKIKYDSKDRNMCIEDLKVLKDLIKVANS